jgi:hypothetical protein
LVTQTRQSVLRPRQAQGSTPLAACTPDSATTLTIAVPVTPPGTSPTRVHFRIEPSDQRFGSITAERMMVPSPSLALGSVPLGTSPGSKARPSRKKPVEPLPLVSSRVN